VAVLPDVANAELFLGDEHTLVRDDEVTAATVSLMRRREFLLSSASGLLASRIPGQVWLGPKAVQPPLDTNEIRIFPVPFSASMREGHFKITHDVDIVTPSDGSLEELSAAKALRDDLADWFGLVLKISSTSALPAGKRAIVIGTSQRSLIRRAIAQVGPQAIENNSLPEAYTLRIGHDLAVISGADSQGVRHGLQSLRQLIDSDDAPSLPCIDVIDRPHKPFRGLKLYLPGPQNIPFFKRFIRDFVVAHKYNILIMELNAGMRLESHPELNAGWREMLLDTNYSRRNYPPGSLHGREQNSCHQDTADGDFLDPQEVAELADFVRSQGIELIPELPSFTHSYYLLARHKELSEVPGDRWPDTYCPSNPKTYELLFEVYDEYIDLLKPRMLHVGHDELFAPVGLCPVCGDRDIGERYGEDVARIRAYLRTKNVGMAMWGDMLLESVRGVGLRERHARDGWSYKVAGGMTREQVERLIPKDILIFNWFWSKAEGEWSEEQAEKNEEVLEGLGFMQVYGNFSPTIENYSTRSTRRTVLGGAPSAWFATSESNFGRTIITDVMGCSNILWHGDVINGRRLADIAQARMPLIRSRFRGQLPPSSTESAFTPFDISSRFNVGGREWVSDCDLNSIQQRTIYIGRVPFRLTRLNEKTAIVVATQGNKPTTLPSSVDAIRIDSDLASLLFLHACAEPAANREPDRLLWDVFDSADLLGWYEAHYEDGYTETIPIRYGVNIAEWDWQSRKTGHGYCYGADPIVVNGESAKPITMFVYEWQNPRPGKLVSELKLKGTHGFRGADADYTDHFGPVIAENAILLLAVSMVKSRESARNADEGRG
jgi:hypothetical protein